MEGVRPQDPIEGRDEHLADVEDARHDTVGFPGVDQEQDDARPDDELDKPEQEDDDAPDEFGPAGLTTGAFDVIACHSFLRVSGIRAIGATKAIAGACASPCRDSAWLDLAPAMRMRTLPGSRHSHGQRSHCTRPASRQGQYLVGTVKGIPTEY